MSCSRCVSPSLARRHDRTCSKRRFTKARTRLVPCPGEAHSNPFIDNCSLCMPRWGWVEIPAKYATLDEYRAAREEGRA